VVAAKYVRRARARGLLSEVPTGIITYFHEISLFGKTEADLTAEKVTVRSGPCFLKNNGTSANYGVKRWVMLKNTSFPEGNSRAIRDFTCFGDKPLKSSHIGQAIMKQPVSRITLKFISYIRRFKLPYDWRKGLCGRLAALNWFLSSILISYGY